MYLEYWHLLKAPFENVNDPSFMYASSKHREALARLRYAVEQKKTGALLVGQYGTGKTYLSRVLRKMCEGPQRQFVFFTNPRLSPEEFLKEIYLQTGGDSAGLPTAKGELSRKVQARFKDLLAKGQHAVVVVDEAQSIEDDGLLEEIRLLLNMQGDEDNYFTLLMLGQPQFAKMLDRIPQFRQRLSVVYVLDHLDAEETAAYVRHRLSVAGAENDIFDDAALREMFEVSQGSPRDINNIGDLALLHAFLKRMPGVTAEVVRAARHETAGLVPLEGS